MEGGLFPPGPPRGAPPRGRVSEVDMGGVVPVSKLGIWLGKARGLVSPRGAGDVNSALAGRAAQVCGAASGVSVSPRTTNSKELSRGE